MESQTKTCQNCKKDFTIEPEDFNFYEKIKVPPPTFCPDCRLVRRLIWRNERYLFKSKCRLCGDSTLSNFSKENEYIIYCPGCYRGDNWDPIEYGKEYGFSKPFFEQFASLLKRSPMRARSLSYNTLINSEYTNLVSNLKNCYLIYNSDYSENCIYGSDIEKCKDCIDNTMIETCEQSYGNLNCRKCYKIFYSTDCIESSDVWFSYDLVSCMSCFGCVGLRNKNYYIFNESFSKDDYAKKIEEIFNGGFDQIKNISARVEKIYLEYPRRYVHGRQNVNTSGDYIYHSKDVKNSYIINGAQNCKYTMWVMLPSAKDCWDYTEYGNNVEQIYETLTASNNTSNVKFSNIVSTNSENVEYSRNCRDVQYVFGCNGLKKKKYCILNKQYSKEEYEKLIPKIKKHMNDMPYIDKRGIIYKYGEYFPTEISLFPYNHTNAQEFFPIKKEDAEALGFKWEDIADKDYVPTLMKEDLPNFSKDVTGSIVNEIIGCEEWGSEKSKMQNCTKGFRIITNELVFYKRHNIPLPRKCPNCRHYDRVKNRNSITLWHRQCMKEGCKNEFETSYAPDRPEIVYCEKCYQQEVY